MQAIFLGNNMRILVVISHYFGPQEFSNRKIYASNVDPIGRIAALNETIVALHRNFGSTRYTFDGVSIPDNGASHPRRLDIIILTKRHRHLLAEIGIIPTSYEVEFVEDQALHIPFHAQTLLKDRLGQYDFYCMMEDDLIIHDPLFFEKLSWFQEQFGPQLLLAPVRFEASSRGNLAKVINDPQLRESDFRIFRRPVQRDEIAASWHGRQQSFRLPSNPHAGSYFLTEEQLAYWIGQPSFDDRDTSWIGPLESAATLSVGKVFDIYKPAMPDPFFLELQHFGIRYAALNTPRGMRYGEPPLLAIAQNALKALIEKDEERSPGLSFDRENDPLHQLLLKWPTTETAMEQLAKNDSYLSGITGSAPDNSPSELRALKIKYGALQERSKSRRWLLWALFFRLTPSWFSAFYNASSPYDF